MLPLTSYVGCYVEISVQNWIFHIIWLVLFGLDLYFTNSELNVHYLLTMEAQMYTIYVLISQVPNVSRFLL